MGLLILFNLYNALYSFFSIENIGLPKVLEGQTIIVLNAFYAQKWYSYFTMRTNAEYMCPFQAYRTFV